MPKLRALDVWTYNLQDGTSARFTFGPAEKTTSVWSRDGKMIALHFRSGSVSKHEQIAQIATQSSHSPNEDPACNPTFEPLTILGIGV